MIELTLQVAGEQAVIGRLVTMTDVLRARLRAEFEKIGPEVQSSVVAKAPARAADRKDRHPGRLRKSIKSRITESHAGVQLQVGPPIFYGGLIEQGLPEKLVTVRRRGRMERHVVGYRARLNKAGLLTWGARRKSVEIGSGAVYTRRFHIDPHPFFAPAFDSMRDRIVARLLEAVRQGAA